MNSHAIANAIEIVTSILSTRYPVDLERICKTFGIKVIDNYPIEKDGYLVCKSGKKVILVNAKIRNYHRKNFVIAHELGHFLLHRNQLFSCDHIGDTADRNINSSSQEQEANEFASELLAPKKELRKIIGARQITIPIILQIAKEFDISITHAAIQAMISSNSETELLLCYDNRRFLWYKSAGRYIRTELIPRYCPISLCPAVGKTVVSGIWDDLFSGSVNQEVFHTYGTQYLVLLSSISE